MRTFPTTVDASAQNFDARSAVVLSLTFSSVPATH